MYTVFYGVAQVSKTHFLHIFFPLKSDVSLAVLGTKTIIPGRNDKTKTSKPPTFCLPDNNFPSFWKLKIFFGYPAFSWDSTPKVPSKSIQARLK